MLFKLQLLTQEMELVAAPHLKEASSWGKVDITKEQMVFAEATSVLTFNRK